ncbi:MAG TPA: pantoate--beta-alanine ligase [Chitinophagaceae bacterium]|nr:pantoate--beta-alanine ligase [Chitinophagaceae bacterium]
MIIIKTRADLKACLDKYRKRGAQLGFVPTMGALHQGHQQLLLEARKACDLVVCSIFVNPTQFNDPVDFQRYPVTLDQDLLLVSAANSDLLFLPSTETLYPEGLHQLEQYDLGFLETIFEGSHRPGHFQGVCQVMSRLLNLVQPDQLFMGAKDYQQCMVIDWLLKHEGMQTALIKVDTVREKDGLAMSSRNLRLSEEERSIAPTLYATLQKVAERLASVPAGEALQEGRQDLERAGFRVDYLEIADANSLQPLEEWDGQRPLVLLAAAFLGSVRLIDNLKLRVKARYLDKLL